MTDYERIESVIRYLELNDRHQSSPMDLANVVGLSETHFHHLFFRWAGVTPKDFLKYLTAKHAKELLKISRGKRLDVSPDFGLSGHGRLHDRVVTLEGITPGEFESFRRGLDIQYGFHPTPFGECLVAQTQRCICHLEFLEPAHGERALQGLRHRWAEASFTRDQASTSQTMRGIPTLFPGELSSGVEKNEEIRILTVGTPFQIKVWGALLTIPESHLLSYRDVASMIQRPTAIRAVGTAIARNSIAYLIPCHRVIRDTGVLGHYRWGAERKKAMLAWESGRASQLTNSIASSRTKKC